MAEAYSGQLSSVNTEPRDEFKLQSTLGPGQSQSKAIYCSPHHDYIVKPDVIQDISVI